MRIGFVSTYPPIECGIATYTLDLRQALDKKQNETFVVSQFGAKGSHVFPVYSPESPTLANDIYSTSIKMTPDVMHIQHEYGLFGAQRGVMGVELLLRYKMAGMPIVTTLHTVYETLNDAEQIILKHIVEESDAIIVHEEFQKETLDRYFKAADKVHVIEHGVREIGPVPDAKEKLGLKGKKVILLCGYFRPTKGLDRIVDLFPEIHEQDEDVVLVVAGKTRNIEFDEYRRNFFKKLNSSPVVDSIKIFRGQFPQHTFDTILSAADVVVLPYEVGAQSGMMAQCFAMHRPVVASDLPAFRKVIERSGGGVNCSTDEEYIEAILKILNDGKERDGITSKCRKYIKESAGWSRIAEKHIDVYHSVVTVPYGKARYIFFPESEDKRQK